MSICAISRIIWPAHPRYSTPRGNLALCGVFSHTQACRLRCAHDIGREDFMKTLIWSVAIGAVCISAPVAGDAFAQQSGAAMTFFVTSSGLGKGADLGGLEGADRHCQQLAQAAGAGSKTWHAYLSTQAADGKPAVNARDRIGRGPWQNAKGEVIAKDVADLHSDNNKINKQTALNEKGAPINGRGDTPN